MSDAFRPLADRLRPENLSEVVGQEHILKKGKVLYNLIEQKKVPNMIFFGPSGTGKTTVANIIAKETERQMFKLNATSASSADIKGIIEQIDTILVPNGVLLYLDEIQYFNKKQQQLLLENMENGKMTIIASTTENPYFYVYNAVLSRCTIFEFKPLSLEDMMTMVERGFKKAANELSLKISCEAGVFEKIALASGGDGRKALNAVDILVSSANQNKEGALVITLESASEVAQRSAMRYDRDGDEHYDILSALQKSIRGSDPDAALHYLGRLLEAGDIISAARRILVCASEDIGLAYPMAVTIVKSCVDAAFELGLPEAQIPLAQAAILLATAPKSNTAVAGISAARADIQNGLSGEIPAYLRSSGYSGAEKLGRAQGYKYPHSFKNRYVKQQYLPDELKDKKYYEFGDNKIEQASKEYWDRIKKGDKEDQ